MAKGSGLGAQLYVGGYDLSNDIGQVDNIELVRGLLDVTGLDGVRTELSAADVALQERISAQGTQLTESMRVEVEYRLGTIPRILPPLSTIATPSAA